jgi:hypothetical protein
MAKERVTETRASTYPRQELIARAREIFGVAPEVVAGALVANTKPELTIAEVQKAVTAFLATKPH